MVAAADDPVPLPGGRECAIIYAGPSPERMDGARVVACRRGTADRHPHGKGARQGKRNLLWH